MTSSRTSFVAGCLVGALALGGGVTAYAAGLAKNSVGTAQLKKNAVTSAKIKNGTVGKKDLATGAVPRSTVVDTRLATEANVSVAKVGGIRYRAVCQGSGGSSAQVYLESISGAEDAISVRGIRSKSSGVVEETLPVFSDAQNDYLFSVEHSGGIGTLSAEVRVRHAGKPSSVVHLTLASADGGAKPCLVDLVVTPTK